jgi:predicted N-acetyltransferase YhbS
MMFSLFNESKSQEVIELFKRVFSASEGEAEGQVIADYVANLIATTARQDLIGCIAEENKIVVGCIFFSRLTVPSEQVAFILSPVAVS